MAAGKPNKHRPLKKTAARAARQTKATKPSTAPAKPAVTTEAKPAATFVPGPMPTVWQLTRRAGGTLWRHKRLFIWIILIYGLLNLIFVTGLGLNLQVQQLRDGFGNRYVGSIATYTQLLSTSTASSSNNGSVYGLLLFIIGSLALIWGLRQVYAGHKLRARDAYYRGMYPLVPFVLVLVVLGLQLLPMILGSAIYEYVADNGVATTALEMAIVIIISLGLALVSLYWLASSLLGFYIVTLPEMTPLAALRGAKQLVGGRRWTVLRKLLFLPLVLIVLSAIVLLPFILLAPAIAPWCLALYGPALIAFAHSYLYGFYRELMGE